MSESNDQHRRFTPREILGASVRTGAFWPTLPSLAFMLMVIIPAWVDPGYGPAQAIALTILAVVFSVQFIACSGIRFYPLGHRIAWLVGMWVVIALFSVLLGPNVFYIVMYVSIAHGVVLPWRSGAVAVSVITVAAVVGSLLVRADLFAILLALAGAAVGLSIGFGIHRSILEDRLDEAERRNAVLAVAAERERIGRDLHDILGHSLTTITVSAQLARRLLEADPGAAGAQLAEIERIARQSLADVRATASGMQQVRAATEIASARSVLLAAGIEADAPVALPVLPEDRAELFGYVIREAITNVVRHSRASRCLITLEEDAVSVSDDGRGIPAGRGRSGLAGLERRVAEAGGTLSVTPTAEGGTRVSAVMTGPDTSPTPTAAPTIAGARP